MCMCFCRRTGHFLGCVLYVFFVLLMLLVLLV
jgi:hypothetical protein